MAANIPGGSNLVPDVIVDVETQARGTPAPGGTRLAVIMGEGSRTETLVIQAIGAGKDGFNPSYSSTNGSDGRHFRTSLFPIISNRTTVIKNGIPLTGLEQAFDASSGSFSSRYDYRIDIETGHIELQTAYLVDQGGSFYKNYSTNNGDGKIDSLSLIDPNAPTETWDIRCVSVRRDSNGDPIDGYAKFIAKGSISGTILDGYGNIITWQSNDEIINNTILQFSIKEGSSPFKEGDHFTVKIKSGALSKGDSLKVTYIALSDLNDPEFFSDFSELVKKHGTPSLTNRLSLGAQIAFANSPPGVWTLQTYPSLPRRISYVVEQKATGGVTADDLTFDLPLNVVPDIDSKINFFVTDAATKIESQILPNKVDFYDSTFTSSPNAFHFGVHTYSYTVVLEDAVIKTDENGIVKSIGPTSATFSSQTIVFDSNDVGKTLRIESPNINAGNYTIVSVSSGVATISGGSFTNSSSVKFEVIDDTLQSSKILFTQDLALGAGDSLRVTVVDTKDASFYDAGWEKGFEALEKIEVDMVVPLPSQTISAIFGAALSHCKVMSQPINKKERVLLMGAIRGLTPDNVLGNKDAAVEDIGVLEGIQGDDPLEILNGNIEDLTNYSVKDAFGGEFRNEYFYPDEIVVQIGADNTKVDGFFMAPAAAGWYSATTNIAIPLTRKILKGFTILNNKLFRPLIIENLSAAGISVVQPVTGGGQVIWGKTTTQSGFAEEEEMSIIFIRDRLAKMLRQSYQFLIGLPQDDTTLSTALARLNIVMQAAKAQGLISAERDLRVSYDSLEPRQINVSAQVVPVYATNWVFCRIGVGPV